MKLHRFLQNALLIPILALLVMGMGSGCRKKEPDPVPTVRAERLLEILRLLDMENYEAAIPKIGQYQELDETNPHLIEIQHIVITNATIVKAEDLLRQGKAGEAYQYIQNAIEKYGELDGLVRAKNAFSAMEQLHDQIAALKKPVTSVDLHSKAAILEKRAISLNSKKIAAFAAKKKAEVPVVKQIEHDRTGFLLFADASDSLQQGRLTETLSLISLLELYKEFFEEGKRLRNGGVYFMADVPEMTQINGGVSNPKNKTTKTK